MDVAIHGDSIKLGQFLKLANLADTGGHAKELIATGQVYVNGEEVAQRGLTLHDGDEVSVGAVAAIVVANSEDEDYFDERTADDDFDPEKWRNL